LVIESVSSTTGLAPVPTAYVDPLGAAIFVLAELGGQSRDHVPPAKVHAPWIVIALEIKIDSAYVPSATYTIVSPCCWAKSTPAWTVSHGAAAVPQLPAACPLPACT